MMQVLIHTDGASRGNPGPAAIGAVIRDEQGGVLARISRAIGTATNNYAEYRAIVAALEEARRLGATVVDLRTDSELIVRQVNGQYRVREASLVPLHAQVKELQSGFRQCSLTHVDGRNNEEAHGLASRALRRSSPPG